jgi:hypothetical protein
MLKPCMYMYSISSHLVFTKLLFIYKFYKVTDELRVPSYCPFESLELNLY